MATQIRPRFQWYVTLNGKYVALTISRGLVTCDDATMISGHSSAEIAGKAIDAICAQVSYDQFICEKLQIVLVVNPVR